MGKLNKGDDCKQEIVAEQSTGVLCYLVGRKPVNLGQHYRYIKDYAKKANKTAYKICIEVIGEVNDVLKIIFE